MSYTNDLLISLNAKVERLITTMQNQDELKKIRELLEEANRLKRIELEMKYPSFKEEKKK